MKLDRKISISDMFSEWNNFQDVLKESKIRFITLLSQNTANLELIVPKSKKGYNL